MRQPAGTSRSGRRYLARPHRRPRPCRSGMGPAWRPQLAAGSSGCFLARAGASARRGSRLGSNRRPPSWLEGALTSALQLPHRGTRTLCTPSRARTAVFDLPVRGRPGQRGGRIRHDYGLPVSREGATVRGVVCEAVGEWAETDVRAELGAAEAAERAWSCGVHDVGGEETEADRRVVRWVEAGFDGQWDSVCEPCNERDTALDFSGAGCMPRLRCPTASSA